MTREEVLQIETDAEDLAQSDHTTADRELASAKIFREIANIILPRSIKMVEDTPHGHPSGYLPILDTEMRVSNGLVEHRHYSKPMASLEVI